jgi:hypothetical protein
MFYSTAENDHRLAFNPFKACVVAPVGRGFLHVQSARASERSMHSRPQPPPSRARADDAQAACHSVQSAY